MPQSLSTYKRTQIWVKYIKRTLKTAENHLRITEKPQWGYGGITPCHRLIKEINPADKYSQTPHHGHPHDTEPLLLSTVCFIICPLGKKAPTFSLN